MLLLMLLLMFDVVALIDVHVDTDDVFDVAVLMLMLILMLKRRRRRKETRRRKDGECTQKPEPQSNDMGK